MSSYGSITYILKFFLIVNENKVNTSSRNLKLSSWNEMPIYPMKYEV